VEIRFKGGQPLMVYGGLIAGSQSCCCENPPPPACYCPDFCSYFIEVVSPSSLAVKSPTAECSSDYFTADVLLFEYEFSDIIFGPGWSYFDGGQFKGRSGAGNYLPLGFLQAFVFHSVSHVYDDPPVGECAQSIAIFLQASISVFCGNDSGFVPGERDPSIVPMLQVQYTASFLRNNRNNFGCVQECWPQLRYDKIIRLPEDCFYNSDRACPGTFGAFDPQSGYRYIQTPLDITVEHGGVTVGGEFFPNTDTVSDPCGPDPVFGEDFRTFINSTVDRHTATFRITARENCLPLPDPCVVTIDGEPVDIRDIDPEVALDVEWTHAGRTLQVPDGQQTFDYFNGVTTGPDVTWHENYTLGLESRKLQVWQLVAGENPALASWTPPGACAKWAVTTLDETTCRIQGCVQTYYVEGTFDSGIRPFESTDYEIIALWKWTCDIVDGVQQAVTYELIESYRYEWDEATLSFLLVPDGDAGDEPVVTVTLAP
jgi:hypothetical protein